MSNVPSRGFGVFTSSRTTNYICARCSRFSTFPSLASGHNRWSKIKHDKGTADQKRSGQRSILAREIMMASKLYGADPTNNPTLANVLAAAKKAGFPKASMAAAVARGQGQSATGEALESLTLEVIIPPSIAMVVDIETDNKKRALSDLRSTINRNGGTVTPTAYLFTRKGRVQFAKDENGLGVDEVLDDAIEAGAEDVEVDEDGSIVLWTQSNNTAAAAAALSKSHGLKAESSDIIWDANEDTMVPLESKEQFVSLKRLVDALQENQSVQGVYVNVLQGNINDEAWSELEEKLGA